MTRSRRFALCCLIALPCLAPLVAPAQEWAQAAERLRAAGKWQDAAAALDPAAQSGDAKAQATLGNLLLARSNPARDEAAGYRWLRRAARQGNVNALATLGYPAPYVAETRLACGAATMTVMTSCTAFAPYEGPFCFAQTFIFELSGERSARRAFTDTYRDFRGSPLLAVQAACLEQARPGYAIDYSNFGNGRECTGCEDRRLFDEGGRRLPAKQARAGEPVKVSRFPSPAALEAWFKE